MNLVLNENPHYQASKGKSHPLLLLLHILGKQVEDIHIDVNFLLLEKIMKEQSSCLLQGCQILDTIKVEDHNISKISDFWSEVDSVHCLNMSGLFATKILYCSGYQVLCSAYEIVDSSMTG